MRSRFAVIVGEDEAARGTARVKDLSSGDEVELPHGDVIGHVAGAVGA